MRRPWNPETAVVLTTPMHYCRACRRYISNTERHDSRPCGRQHPNDGLMR